jgi:hypothetical protein
MVCGIMLEEVSHCTILRECIDGNEPSRCEGHKAEKRLSHVIVVKIPRLALGRAVHFTVGMGD